MCAFGGCRDRASVAPPLSVTHNFSLITRPDVTRCQSCTELSTTCQADIAMSEAKANGNGHRQVNDMEMMWAFSFLTFVAVTKTLLTKLVFTHVDTPVAFSVLSCIATMLVILPVFIWKPSYFGWIKREMLWGFIGCSGAIAVDLGCTNVAISELSVAMQQTIKATSPAATVLLEVAFARKCQHPVIFMLIGLLCFGSVLVKWGSSDYDATPYGMIMMILAVISGAFKYVLAHSMIRTFRDELGVLAFTFWVEVLVAIMLTPWAVLNGEAEQMMFGGAVSSASDWWLLWFTGAYGGVRIVSQFALLVHTSATTLALSNVTIQALTTILGIFLFGTPVTNFLVAGVSVTLIATAGYTYVKTSKVLEKYEKNPPLI